MSETTEFLSWLTQQWSKDDLLEIRCTPVKNVASYREIEYFSKKYNVYMNKKRSLFFSLEQIPLVDVFLVFVNSSLGLSNEKVCYGISPRRKNSQTHEIEVSGIDAIPYFCVSMFDIEEVYKRTTPFSEESSKDLTRYVETLFETVFKEYFYTQWYFIDSGRGRHVLFQWKKRENTEENRRVYNEFMKEILERMKTSLWAPDAQVRDISRVFGLVGTMNVKWKRNVSVLKKDIDKPLQELNIWRRKKQFLPKTTTSVNLESPTKFFGDISQNSSEQDKVKKLYASIEWWTFVHEPTPGEVNSCLLFALKLLCKELYISDGETIHEIEREIYKQTGEHWTLSRLSGIQGKSYHPRIVLNWIERHKEWKDKNKKELEKFGIT